VQFASLLAVAVVIALLCWSWMQSTRASQRRTEAQNQRIIELLERIAGSSSRHPERSEGSPDGVSFRSE
jgi:membrane protein implicated in regulation of membrane protease activity